MKNQIKETSLGLLIDYGLQEQNGKICSLGRFEGQPIEVLYFYEAYMNGDQGLVVDEDMSLYNLTKEESKYFNGAGCIGLAFDFAGFVGLLEFPGTAEEIAEQ